MENKYAEFIKGFAKATNLDYPEARELWAWYSHQLSDADRTNDEQQGEDRGYELGGEYLIDTGTIWPLTTEMSWVFIKTTHTDWTWN